MATDFVFPEDSGTGAAGGDNADAANFATLAYATGIADKVVEGLGFSNISYGTSFDLDAGLLVVTDASADEAQTAETRDQGVAYAAIVASRTGISLSSSGVDSVYVEVDLSSDDTINVVTSSPSQPYLKIGEIDNDNSTNSLWNRVRIPVDVYQNESDVPRLDEGQFVWVSSEERYYYEDGN